MERKTMERKDNYLIQANQAKQHFLTYDQEKLIQKLKALSDGTYIYVTFLQQPYRINRKTGNIDRCVNGAWVDGNSYEEVMTLLDLVCDSRDDRWRTCRWRSMADLGLQFHQNLLEEKRDRMADLFDQDPEGLRRACEALQGRPISGADISYAIELFDGLEIGIQFWHGDDEFYPRLRYLWDENALMYIRYETMYFAVSLLLKRLREQMKK